MTAQSPSIPTRAFPPLAPITTAASDYSFDGARPPLDAPRWTRFPGVWPHVPPPKDSTLNVRDFDDTEVYKGLGTGFAEWADMFRTEVAMAEEACQYPWDERFKCFRLSYYLRGRALQSFTPQSPNWWKQGPTLEFALDPLGSIFVTTITSAQCAALYQTKMARN
ncbi:TPA: hypothetical protein N0F65_010577 [Lagenidium giganteum]|uniref:Uncharacterized protein n=1 Tax=Lagenidium giganteum TaxID=4803 RepID=A0AAV2ZD50_9STRA|nr:TPA: hypothetical protein N0F65_010577 [Lagenidium giganteum]